jgi:gamma-glutamyl:cysteine ligase YbdK (ATP-grasp superfamily)
VAAALPDGARPAGAGTHPLVAGRVEVTPASRYRRIAREYGDVATHLVPFGQHVHVSAMSRRPGRGPQG